MHRCQSFYDNQGIYLVTFLSKYLCQENGLLSSAVLILILLNAIICT